MRGEPIGPIPIQVPTPSILTTATPRTNNDFGARVPLPGEVDVPEGALDPSKSAWRTGVSWMSTACAPSVLQQQCPTADDVELDASMDPDAMTTPTSVPFWAFTTIDCAWTNQFAGEIDDMAAALSDARGAYALGRALWMGESLPATFTDGVADQATLRNSATVAPGGDVARPLEDAFALLQAAYSAATQGLGGATYHLPDPMVVYALGGGDGGLVMKQEGNFYRGPNGSVVSPGPGYPFGASDDGADGFGPLVDDDPLTYTGNDEDEIWVYITGPVEYAMSSVVPLPVGVSFRRQNRKVAIAMRQLIYRFDPCSTFAALVQSAVPFEGEGS